MDIKRISLPEQHYLYVDRDAAFATPGAIAEAMASGFGAVFAFARAKGISPLTMPSSIYIEMPAGDVMKFRAAFFVSAEDATKAEGDIKAAIMPAGDALTATHVGGYASLNLTHRAIWDHMDANGLAKGMPVWEIYVDDPTTVAEADCRTDLYRRIGR